jgi:hypothetical protein
VAGSTSTNSAPPCNPPSSTGTGSGGTGSGGSTNYAGSSGGSKGTTAPVPMVPAMSLPTPFFAQPGRTRWCCGFPSCRTRHRSPGSRLGSRQDARSRRRARPLTSPLPRECRRWPS